MVRFDSSSLDMDELQRLAGEKKPVAPRPSSFDARPHTVAHDDEREERNRQTASVFADIAPAEPSGEIEDTERRVLERLREMDPQKYDELLNGPSTKDDDFDDERPPMSTGQIDPKLTLWQKVAKKLGFSDNDPADAWLSVLDRPLKYPAVLGVSSFKGGCGKTTLSSMAAATIKRARPYSSVIVVDFDPSGNLANRARGTQYSDVQDYADAISRGETDPSAYVMTTPDDVDILGSRLDELRPDLTARQIVEIVETLEDFYDIVIIDMPQRTSTKAYKAILLMLDVIVYVFEAKNDALDSVGTVVPILQSNGADYLIDRRVIAFNHTIPAQPKSDIFNPREVVRDLIHKDNVEVLQLPYDDYLRTAGVLDGSKISPSQYRQFVQLAAAMINSIEADRTEPKPTVRQEE